MAKVFFDEGDFGGNLADGGLTTLTAYLSTKACSGGGAHVAGDTYAGGFGNITGTGYSGQTATEPSHSGTATSVTKAYPTVSFSTGAATDWSNAVKSVVYVNGSNQLVFAEDLSATRDMSAAYRTITHQLTVTLAVS